MWARRLQLATRPAFRLPLNRFYSQKPNDGSDLFSQAKAAENKSNKTGSESPEDERIRRLVDEAEKKEQQERSQTFKFLSVPGVLGILATYWYLGYSSTLESEPDENAFVAHNRKVWDSLKDAYYVSAIDLVLV